MSSTLIALISPMFVVTNCLCRPELLRPRFEHPRPAPCDQQLPVLPLGLELPKGGHLLGKHGHWRTNTSCGVTRAVDTKEGACSGAGL